MLGVTANSSHIAVGSIPRFSPILSETFNLSSFTHTSDYSLGGNFQGGSVNGSLSGIINKVWYKSFQITTTTEYEFPSKPIF